MPLVPDTLSTTVAAARPGRQRGIEVVGRFEGGRASVRLVAAGDPPVSTDRALIGWATDGDPATLPIASLEGAKGQWAAVRTAGDGRLEAAVDHLGDVPLYWASRSGTTVVSSHLPLLLTELGLRAQPHLPRVLEWIAWSFTDPLETLFDGVRIVPPGHALVVDEDGPRLQRYWKLEAHLDNRTSADEWMTRLRRGLNSSLRRHVPDEPYALLLSGGLDSSLLAGWITADDSLPRPAVAASLRYPGLPSDESAYQDAVLRFTGLQSLVIEPQPFDPDSYVDRIRGAATPVHVAAPETDALYRTLGHEGIHIALDGAGGDELFTPIRWGVEELLLQRRWGTLARWWRTQGWQGIRSGLRERAALLDPPGTRRWRARRRLPTYVPPAAARRYLGTRLVPERSLPGIHATGSTRAGYFTSAMLMVGRSIDNDQSRLSDVEFRTPLLDVDLVQLALAIPDSLRHANDDPRWLERQAFADRLPPELISRRDKVHFDYRYAQHLQHPWVRGQLETSRLAAAGLLDRDAVLAAYDELAAFVASDVTRIPTSTGRLWRIVALETWWREFVE